MTLILNSTQNDEDPKESIDAINAIKIKTTIENSMDCNITIVTKGLMDKKNGKNL